MDSGTTTVKTPGQAGELTIVYEVTRDATGKEISRVEKEQHYNQSASDRGDRPRYKSQKNLKNRK